jgi:site-specific DNA-methyltransferase (adenine-specific)
VTNKLYYGDNRVILREQIGDGSVDMIYVDPPFNSRSDYNVLFQEQDGTASAAKVQAFTDTWHWNPAAEEAYLEVLSRGSPRLAAALGAMRELLGPSDMLAYLVMMATRLQEMYRVLHPRGSLYLHCDPTASHYIKMLLDSLFGPTNFRNEIIWKRYSSHGNVSKKFGTVHDVILFYVKSPDAVWNQQFTKLDEEYVQAFFRHTEPDTGRRYRLQNVLNPNRNRPNLTYEWNGHTRTWKWTRERLQGLHDQGRLQYSRTGYPQLKQYLDESPGQALQDVWLDIASMQSLRAERLGYPTQKPVGLVERLIGASTEPDGLVLDPFCGCGTTIAAAERLGRRWIGIDTTTLAISLTRYRMGDLYPDQDIEVQGQPADAAEARMLAEADWYQFLWWALSLARARPAGDADQEKGADSGIDGLAYFVDDGTGKPKKVVFLVKSGKVGPAVIRDLKRVVEQEAAAIGVLITLDRPTAATVKEAVTARNYHSPGWARDYPGIQILSVEGLLNGTESLETPPNLTTFRKAKISNAVDESNLLLLDV